MVVPAPTPYVVPKYSTDSAGEAFGQPIVELLHDYYHHGSDDFQANQDYGISLIGVFASIIALGLWFLLVLWCFNCCACCRCCRNMLGCCFNVFEAKRKQGKAVVVCIFVAAAIIATTATTGGDEFKTAVFQIGDQMRYVADIFDDMSNVTSQVSAQSSRFVSATASMNCGDAGAESSFQSTSDTMEGVGDSLDGLVDGVSETIRDKAKYIEKEFPPWVDRAMLASTCLIWFNVLLGSCAVLTNCKTDDCLVILIGSITILVFAIAVAAELTLATFSADICYAEPLTILVEEVSSDIVSYYLTCNGTSPFSPHFDDARDSVIDFRNDISQFGDNCDPGPIEIIGRTANATSQSITDLEEITGCASINPLFTTTMFNIFCDEVVRGLFVTLMVQAAAAFLLFVALMVFPCASNAKPMFKDPKDMARSLSPLRVMSNSTKVFPDDQAQSQAEEGRSPEKEVEATSPQEERVEAMEMQRMPDSQSAPSPPQVVVLEAKAISVVDQNPSTSDARPAASAEPAQSESGSSASKQAQATQMSSAPLLGDTADADSSLEDAEIKNMVGQEF